MIRLRQKPDLDEMQRYESVRDDVDYWVNALKSRGFDVSAEDVYASWRRHSEASCAGWLAPHGDDQQDCNALLHRLVPHDRNPNAS